MYGINGSTDYRSKMGIDQNLSAEDDKDSKTPRDLWLMEAEPERGRRVSQGNLIVEHVHRFTVQASRVTVDDCEVMLGLFASAASRHPDVECEFDPAGITLRFG